MKKKSPWFKFVYKPERDKPLEQRIADFRKRFPKQPNEVMLAYIHKEAAK